MFIEPRIKDIYLAKNYFKSNNKCQMQNNLIPKNVCIHQLMAPTDVHSLGMQAYMFAYICMCAYKWASIHIFISQGVGA